MGLLIHRSRRRRAEEELRNNRNELRASYERNRDLGARLLNAQENERARIARELHDDICQRMLLLTIDLESLPQGKGEAAAHAAEAARDISRSLHSLSHRLHPTRLRVIGLVAALKRLCAEVSRGGFAVSFKHEGVPPTLAPELMLCVFRLVQEALQNAIKHSRSSEVSVSLMAASDELGVRVVDNGVGFDVNGAWRNGLGLISMLERVEAIGGSLQIRSTPGGGTSVVATMPLAVAPPVTEQIVASGAVATRDAN
jgi:signal transduction histidine kinase